MLMGDGDVSLAGNIMIEQIDYEIAAAHYDTVQFTAVVMGEPIAPIWTLNTTDYGTISSSGLFTPKDEETTDTNALSHTVKVTASYLSEESSTDLLIYPVITIPPERVDNDEDAESEDEDANDDEPKGVKVSKEDPVTVFKGGDGLGGVDAKGGFDIDGNNIENPNEEAGLGDDGFGNNGNSGI
jgi:hypothetical protein